MDISVGVTDYGDFEPIDVEDLPVSGRDGWGEKTPTVRELAEILRALPEEFQDLPVARYVDEGIRGLKLETSYPREERDDVPGSTPHVQLW